MGDTDTEDEAKKAHMAESTIMGLKIKKSRCKAAFTRRKNRLIDAVNDEEPSAEFLKEQIDKLEQAMDDAINAIENLTIEYQRQGKTKEMKSTMTEVDDIEAEYNKVLKKYHETVNDTDSVKSDSEERTVKKQINSDLTGQLKRVTIPVFSGNKRDYPFWSNAFTACVDSTDASAEFKFLQMRQYLRGEALKTIEGLGHSKLAYEKAKERLERKYGGTRRRIALYMEEIQKFPAMKYENARNIEKFSDLIDIAVINMEEEDHQELGNGVLYTQAQKKLPESMLTRYHRYIGNSGEKESLTTLQHWIVNESQYHTIANETIYGLGATGITGKEKDGKIEKSRAYYGNNTGMKKKTCGMCDGDHQTYTCQKFKSLDVPSRWQVAKDKKLCFRCLRNNHRGNECRSYKKCGTNGCVKTHDRLLHMEPEPEQKQLNVNAEEFNAAGGSPEQCMTLKDATSKIALRTVPVILTSGNKSLKINALLDDGSSKSYLNEDIAYELGLDGELEEMHVNVLNGKNESFKTKAVEFTIESVDKQERYEIEANTIKNVTGSMNAVDWNDYAENYEHLKYLKFPRLTRKRKVDLLIGIDNIELHRSLKEIRGQPGEPIARLTPLGWTCVGVTERTSQYEPQTHFSYFISSDGEELNTLVKQFWELESCPVQSKESELSVVNREILSSSKENMTNENGHYVVQLPWKESSTLPKPNNYEMALKRLTSTEKKLGRNPEVKQQYENTIKNYQEKGYITEVETNQPENDISWYLPHFPVIKPQRETTKVRIVFDASAKYKGTSLNDTIHEGPKLQNELFDVLLRFRKKNIAVVSDVAEMYLRVGIIPSDRRFQRFLWNSKVYEFNTLVFGINASPFLAQLVSQENAKAKEDEYPRAAESVIKSTYMDDTMDSVDTPEEGIELYRQLIGLWETAGMKPRKWLSNSQAVLNEIPPEEIALKTEVKYQQLPTVKTLGLDWDSHDDQFLFRNTSLVSDEKLTKRLVLKNIARLFDPLGFLVPFTLRAKLIMQDIWVTGVDWDDELPGHLCKDIKQWFSELEQLEEVKIQRCLNINSDSTLHTFVDASSGAYGAVVYAVTSEENNEQVSLVASKSRVSPLKSISIPRLELLGATLGLQLTRKVCDALEKTIENVVFWSDSMNVLYWIHGASRQYKTFVANRVGTIHEITSPGQWRHVPTKDNPADLASRGSSIHNLAECSLWWHGPEFLKHSEEQWPDNVFEMTEEVKVEMKRKPEEDVKHSFVVTENNEESRLDPSKYSDWNRLVRVTAWVHRFINNCQMQRNNRRLSRELSLSEIQDAENKLIRSAQVEAFEHDYLSISNGKTIPMNSKLAPLNPKVDTDGLLRSDSRLKYAKYIPYDVRYPIILPRKHSVTKLIVKHNHELVNHGGINQTLASLSSRFWIIAAREAIRQWEANCAECRRRKAKASQQIMAPLPVERLGHSMKAFTNTAVDYAGPFITKQGRGKVRLKRYLCVFTCLETRAVHLEVSYSMDTNSFLNTLYRFISRRGVPDSIISDNGSNFVGCVNELRELYELLDKNVIIRKANEKRINWKFLPPNAPHFGGVHESMVKCAKRALFAVLKNSDITDEELITAVVGAEGLMNSRPLTYQTSSPDDNTVLTPNHFLHGQSGGDFAPDKDKVTAADLQRRWRFVQELLRHFWKRWITEYVTTLGVRNKWLLGKRDFEPGDVVMIVEPDIPRGQWRLGRITKVFPGKDGHVRVTEVKVGNNVLKRPITRLALLQQHDQ